MGAEGLGTGARVQVLSGFSFGPCPTPAQIPSTAPAYSRVVVLNQAHFSPPGNTASLETFLVVTARAAGGRQVCCGHLEGEARDC